MTNPEAETREPEPLGKPAKDSATSLGRISRALQRQDWATVLIEVAIVVLGVVIGFQVTAWGQARTNQAREHAYLHQLAADLRETAADITRMDSYVRPSEEAGAMLHRAFYRPEPLSRDSLLSLLAFTTSYLQTRPVVGTAQALVGSGDLSLIRNDSLRSAITAYLETVDNQVSRQTQLHSRRADALMALNRGRGASEEVLALLPEAAIDSLARTDPLFPIPPQPRRQPFPLDAAMFLSDPTMLDAVYTIWLTDTSLRSSRQQLREESVSLLDHVEANLGS